MASRSSTHGTTESTITWTSLASISVCHAPHTGDAGPPEAAARLPRGGEVRLLRRLGGEGRHGRRSPVFVQVSQPNERITGMAAQAALRLLAGHLDAILH